MFTSELVAPWSVELAAACPPGISESGGLGRKVDSRGAVPGGCVSAWNSGAASLPTRTPGACCDVLAVVLGAV
ncbi:hypothetical protein IMZ48_16000 [Candidatus Bathyarchaeota archaeon]|nr:hypothetical protein [Candidatus Bathyarchaeota archaeon]